VIRAVRLLNLRSLRAHPLRFLLTVVAIGAATCLGVSVAATAAGVSSSLSHTEGRLAGSVPLRVVGPVSRGGLTDDVVERIARAPGVAAAVPTVQAVTVAKRPSGRDEPLLAVGVDCRVEAIIGHLGCSPEAVGSTAETSPPLLSVTLRRRLGPQGVIRTDRGSLPVRFSLTSRGLDSFNEGSVAVFPLKQSQLLFGRDGRVDAVYVKPAKGQPVASLQRELAAALGPSYGVLDAHDPPPGAQVTVAFLPLLGLIGLLALVIGAILVANIVGLSLQERRRELAVSHAVGATRRLMLGCLLGEGFVVGILGAAIGSVAGVFLARSVTGGAASLATKLVGLHVHPRTSWTAGAVAVVLAVAVAVIGSLWAYRRARPVDVVEELQQKGLPASADGATSMRPIIWLLAAGLAGIGACYFVQRQGGVDSWAEGVTQLGLIVAGVCLLLAAARSVPVLLRLSLPGLRRLAPTAQVGLSSMLVESRRIVGAAGAVAAAVGVACVIASATSSVRQATLDVALKLAGDRVWVSTLPPSNSVNIDAKTSPALRDALAHRPGVASVDANYSLVVGHQTRLLSSDQPIGVEASDRPTFPYRVLQGAAEPTTFDRNEVLVGATLARRNHLRPGSTLRLEGLGGPTVVRVGGVWLNPAFDGRVVTMSVGQLRAIAGPQPPSDVFVRPAAGVSAADLARQLRAARLDPDLRALTAGDLGQAVSDDIVARLAPFWALQRAFVVVAFVAVVCTLLLVGFERRRELAIFAAVGLPRRRLALLAVIDALGVALVGAALGAAAGFGISEALREAGAVLFGLRGPLQFPLTTPLTYGALAVVVAVGAAAAPAWVNSRIEIVETLRYE
jgi:putative ABC transport system permease protein